MSTYNPDVESRRQSGSWEGVLRFNYLTAIYGSRALVGELTSTLTEDYIDSYVADLLDI